MELFFFGLFVCEQAFVTWRKDIYTVLHCISFKNSSCTESWKRQKPAIDPAAQKEGQLVKSERWWLKGEARWLDRRRSVLCVWKGKVSNHKVAGWRPHNGSYGRLDLTPMPLAKVIAFSSGLYNTLQSPVQTHTRVYTFSITRIVKYTHSLPLIYRHTVHICIFTSCESTRTRCKTYDREVGKQQSYTSLRW